MATQHYQHKAVKLWRQELTRWSLSYCTGQKDDDHMELPVREAGIQVSSVELGNNNTRNPLHSHNHKSLWCLKPQMTQKHPQQKVWTRFCSPPPPPSFHKNTSGLIMLIYSLKIWRHKKRLFCGIRGSAMIRCQFVMMASKNKQNRHRPCKSLLTCNSSECLVHIEPSSAPL